MTKARDSLPGLFLVPQPRKNASDWRVCGARVNNCANGLSVRSFSETIANIRRAFFVQGKPIKAICRELRVSRKVVRKVIRSEATEFRYEREAQPLPKIGPWRDRLDQVLLANEGKAARERLTLIRLFEELRGLGYMANCSSWVSMSPSPRFRSTWCPGEIGRCRPPRIIAL